MDAEVRGRQAGGGIVAAGFMTMMAEAKTVVEDVRGLTSIGTLFAFRRG
jgi:hypothetical protein